MYTPTPTTTTNDARHVTSPTRRTTLHVPPGAPLPIGAVSMSSSLTAQYSNSIRSTSSPSRRTVAAPVMMSRTPATHYQPPMTVHQTQVFPTQQLLTSPNLGAVVSQHQQQQFQQQQRVAQTSQHLLSQQSQIKTQQHLPAHGQGRVISVNSRVDDKRTRVIGERAVEHQIKVPKKVVREDVVERIVVVPEVIRREEVVEELQSIKERVIEVAKPVIQETVVEVPEYVYVDKVVEVPEVILKEKITHVPRVEIEERVRQIPKVITTEKIVEVPDIEYVEYLVEKIVEVPELHEHIITTEVPVPQYVDVPVPQYVDVEDFHDVPRNIPVPVESTSTFEYQLPVFKPRVTTVKFPVYLPRFVEVPIAEELLDPLLAGKAEANRQHVALLGEMTQAVSLCEVENLAMQVRSLDLDRDARRRDLKEALREAWLNGTVHVTGETSEQRALRTRMMGYHARARSVSRPATVVRSRSVSVPRSPSRF